MHLTTLLVTSGAVTLAGGILTFSASVAASSPVTHSLVSHQEIQNRHRSLTSDGLFVDPLYQGVGTHYVDLWVGCPAQRQTLIIDSGSGLTAFPCLECDGCDATHIDKVFRQTESSCFRLTQCNDCYLGGKCQNRSCVVSKFYAEGSSWQAVEGIDRVYAGGNHTHANSNERNVSFDFHFGCQVSLTGLFLSQWADGIMGMKADEGSYWKQLYRAGVIDVQQFSLCYSQKPIADKKGTEAGFMVLGNHDNAHMHATPMVFAKMHLLDGHYAIHLEKIHLRAGGGESVGLSGNAPPADIVYKTLVVKTEALNEGDFIVDSGTTVTYLGQHLAKPFSDAWKEIMGEPYDSHAAYELTMDQFSSFPTLLFQMSPSSSENDQSLPGIVGPTIDRWNPNSIVVAFPPSHYLHYDSKNDLYSVRIFFHETKGKKQVFGANFMQGKDIRFDLDSMRMGFAESDCNYYKPGILDDPADGEGDVTHPATSSPNTRSVCSVTCAVGRAVGAALLGALLVMLARRGWNARQVTAYRPAQNGLDMEYRDDGGDLELDSRLRQGYRD